MNKSEIPLHVGLILDGNRRWALENGVSGLEGHNRGSQAVEPVLRALLDGGVKYVSLFIFSAENWQRTEDEIGYLMKLFIKYFKKEGQRLLDEGAKVLFAGRIDDQINPEVRSVVKELEDKSKDNQKGTIIFCFNYGGRAEIVDATKKLINEGKNPNEIDEQVFTGALYQPQVPDIDLIIRTSGEKRLSGFQLWRSAYSEFIFVDKFWPDFTAEDAQQALLEYRNRQRRMGK